MALLTTNSMANGSGLLATYVSAAGGGDTVAYLPTKKQFLHVKNGGGSPITVTVTAQRTSISIGHEVFTRANVAQSVTNATERFIPLTPEYVDASGLFQITYSGVTSVTVAAVDM